LFCEDHFAIQKWGAQVTNKDVDTGLKLNTTVSVAPKINSMAKYSRRKHLPPAHPHRSPIHLFGQHHWSASGSFPKDRYPDYIELDEPIFSSIEPVQ
jgi:hypothetical protein